MQNNLLNYYARTNEAGRLARVESELELMRTRDILSRHLPSPPAIVLDVGGGPAVHSYWLASLEYQVHLPGRKPHEPITVRCNAAAAGLSVVPGSDV